MPFVLTLVDTPACATGPRRCSPSPAISPMCSQALRAAGPELSEDEVLLADVYAWRSDDREATTDDELSTRLKEHLAAADCPPP